MTTAVSMKPDVIGFGHESLHVEEIEWSASPVPELPAAAMFLPGLALLLLRRAPFDGRSRHRR